MATTETLLRPVLPPVDTEYRQVFAATESMAEDASALLAPDKDHLTQEKENFFSANKTSLPNLRPKDLDESALADKEKELILVKDALAVVNGHSDIRQAYLWRINENIASIRLAHAAASGDMRRFDAYNHFIYGRPKEAVYGAVIDWICKQAEQNIQSATPILVDASEKVLTRFDDQRGDSSLLEPNEFTFNAVRNEHFRENGYYPLLLAGVELPEAPINKMNGDVVVEGVLRNLGANYAIVDASGLAWSVTHQQAEVRRPVNYKLSTERFLGLPIGHEIGSHILEFVNGKNSSIGLCSAGFDRYELGNEGRALIREQVAYEEFKQFTALPRWQMILRRHLATSLALDMSGEQSMFPTVFEDVNMVDRMFEAKKSVTSDVETIATKADNRTWELLAGSIYKGTDGTAPYRRYMVYLEGNIASWLTAGQDPTMISYGDRGKFDINNPRHLALLKRYDTSSETETA